MTIKEDWSFIKLHNSLYVEAYEYLTNDSKDFDVMKTLSVIGIVLALMVASLGVVVYLFEVSPAGMSSSKY